MKTDNKITIKFKKEKRLVQFKSELFPSEQLEYLAKDTRVSVYVNGDLVFDEITRLGNRDNALSQVFFKASESEHKYAHDVFVFIRDRSLGGGWL